MFGQGNVDKDESFHKEPAEKVFSGLVFVDLLNIMFFYCVYFPLFFLLCVICIVGNAMVLCVGFSVFKLGTVDGLHLLAGPETEGLNVCVSLVFEVGQIALTSLLRRAAGIESSFKQPLPPSTVMRLSSIDAQRQRLPRQPLVTAPRPLALYKHSALTCDP